VDARKRFDRLRLINLIIELAALLRNRQYACTRHALKRIGRCAMEHADAQIAVIECIDRDKRNGESGKNPLENLRVRHAASIAEAVRLILCAVIA